MITGVAGRDSHVVHAPQAVSEHAMKTRERRHGAFEERSSGKAPKAGAQIGRGDGQQRRRCRSDGREGDQAMREGGEGGGAWWRVGGCVLRTGR